MVVADSSPRPATIYDVAKLAGVSHQTVARVLKGVPGIKPHNVSRVEEAVRRLNYRPNVTARALATSRSRRIGAMVYGLDESGPSQFIHGASDAARELGYLLDVVNVNADQDGDVSAAIGLLNQPDLAGVLALAPTDALHSAVAGTQFQIPVYEETEPEDSAFGVHDDMTLNSAGTLLALDYLVGLGHRRILHIAGPQGWVSARNRARAYRAGMLRHGLEPLPHVEAGWTAAAGYEAFATVASLDDVTAVLAANDQVALAVLHALNQRGLEVPAQMSVVGFDDIPEAPYMSPPLTTVRLNFERQGSRAIHDLVADIENRPRPARDDTSSVQLIVRGSTGPTSR